MLGEDSILAMDGGFLAAVIYGLSIALAMWLGFVGLTRLRGHQRTVKEHDRGTGAWIALVICALMVVADEATLVVGLALVVYALVLGVLIRASVPLRDSTSPVEATQAIIASAREAGSEDEAATRCERRPTRSRRGRRSGRPCTNHTRRSARESA